MNRYVVNSMDDPRVTPYRQLRDRDVAREGDQFIAEGEHIVRRLLDSDFPVESVMLAERRVEEMGPLVPADVPIYVASNETMKGIIGYRFHSGVIACGRRKTPPTLHQVVDGKQRLMLVICPEISNTENLGSLVRISAAFGVDAMILGEHSCDPFWRQAIRVSMGTVFRLPIVRSMNLKQDLQQLRSKWAVELAATVVQTEAEELAAASRGPKMALLFGNEAQGLDETWLAECDRRITIPMKWGTDSLNVAVAAGVFLYHFTQE